MDFLRSHFEKMHLSEVTSYKIHTLVENAFLQDYLLKMSICLNTALLLDVKCMDVLQPILFKQINASEILFLHKLSFPMNNPVNKMHFETAIICTYLYLCKNSLSGE